MFTRMNMVVAIPITGHGIWLRYTPPDLQRIANYRNFCQSKHPDFLSPNGVL